jgi:LEA14-like dessication related protein
MKITYPLFKTAVPILLIIILSSCKYQNIEFKKIEDLKLDKVGLKEISATVVADIYNPNRYKITITQYNVLISVNTIQFRSANPKAGIVIPAKYDSLISIPIDMEIESKILAFKTIKSITETFSKRSAEVTLTGFVIVKIALLSKKIPLDEKTVVNFKKNN